VSVLSCVGSGLATALIPRPRSPTYEWAQVREPNPSRYKKRDEEEEKKEEEEK
jgi:hypothetical protein